MKFPKSKIGAVLVLIYIIFVLTIIAYSYTIDSFWRELYFATTILPWSFILAYFSLDLYITTIGRNLWSFSLLFWILNIFMLYFIGCIFTNLLKKRKSRSAWTLRSSLRCGARGRLADFRFAHPDITAIIWNFPAKNSQILRLIDNFKSGEEL